MKKLNMTLLLVIIGLAATGQTYNMSNTTITTCNGIFRDAGGAGNYPHNQNTIMTIQPGVAGSFVQLNFTAFSTQVNFDYLAIYDGSNTTFPLIGSFSGTTSPNIIAASSANTSGALTVVFVSNGWGNSSGWSALISCNTTGGTPVFSQRNGTFSTCNARIFDSGGQTHKHTWFENSEMTLCPSVPGNCLRLDLESVHLETYADTLLIFDGTSSASSLIAGFGNTNNTFVYPAQTIESTTGNSTGCLTLRFSSDLWTEESGWSGTLTCVPCAAPPIISMYRGTVNSCSGVFYDTGGAANNYMNENSTFVQTICGQNPATQAVSVNFDHLSLENGYDFLRVYDGQNTSSPLLASYTGNLSPFNVYANNPSGCLTFELITDLGTSSSGWSASLSCLEFTTLSTHLASLNATPFENYNELNWSIDQPEPGYIHSIQSSSDGLNYKELQTVLPAPNQSQFHCVDLNPGKEITYYKLYFTNMEGEAELKGEISVKTPKKEKWEVAPNPFTDELTISLGEKNLLPFTYILTDVNGRTIQTSNVCELSEKMTISTSELERGIYFLSLSNTHFKTIFKLERI